MQPLFPSFKKLDLEDKPVIDQFVSQFPPYSDYNFISLFVWNTEPEPLFCFLNNNLVIRINDYITNEPFFSFLGTSQTIETAKTMLEYASLSGSEKFLKLIPEVSIQADPKIQGELDIVEDRDQFDYIFSIPELESHSGKDYGAKRNFINRFKKLYKFAHQKLDLKNPQTQAQVLELFKTWGDVRKKDEQELAQEMAAYKKVLEAHLKLKLIIIGLLIDNKLVGISINEVMHDGYAINLFEKGDIRYTGVFQMLKHLAGVYLIKEGCQFLNFEQDMGVMGLRKSKISYYPKFFLKKYIIYPKT